MYSQTDVSLQHVYKFGRDKRFQLIGEFNVLNLFNQATVTSLNTTRFVNTTGVAGEDLDPCYIFDAGINTPNPGCTTVNHLLTQAMNNVLNGKAGAAFAALETPSNRNKAYGLPTTYQGGRNIQFGARLRF